MTSRMKLSRWAEAWETVTGGGGRSEDLFGSGSPGLGLEDGEATENVEAEFVGVAPFDLVGQRELAAEGEVASDGVSADFEDPTDERGASGDSLSAGLMGLDLVDKGGGSGGVGTEIVKD